MSNLTAVRVEETIKDCLADDDQPEGTLKVRGIIHTYALVPEKVEEHAEAIHEMLLDLPEQFQQTGGGGWSFLNACQDKDDNQWTSLHLTMEQLVVLGIAAGWVRFQMPREMWPAFPGGMPYFIVLAQREGSQEPVEAT